MYSTPSILYMCTYMHIESHVSTMCGCLPGVLKIAIASSEASENALNTE